MKKILCLILSAVMLLTAAPLALVGHAAAEWSDWVLVLPEGNYEYETKTQIRYRDKETTTSTSDHLDGWTLVDTSVTYGDWGGWSGWTPDWVGGSETREVQTATIYGYYYFQCPNCGMHWHGWDFNCFYWRGGCGTYIPESSWHQMWSDVSWDQAGFQDFYGTGKYVTYYFGEEYFRWSDGNGSPRTGYRYRDRIVNKVYTYERWGEYTDWFEGDIIVTPDREFEARTLYRYRDIQSEKTYTVKYDANGGAGAPASQTKKESKALTLSATKPTKSFKITYNANGGSVSPASKTVNCKFTGWNTKKDGTGTAYAAGASYKKNADATLYAQWTNPKAGELAAPTRSGYTFNGWYTAASGGKKVTDASTISADTTLYARWPAVPKNTYTIQYDANGGSGAPASQTKTEGKTLTLSSAKPTKSFKITYNANGGSVSPSSKTVDCGFTGWNTKKDGSGTAYAAGASYKKDAAATLYAQWSNPKAGALAAPTRSGYTFNGWYTAASGGKKVTDSSTISADITLYAQWKKAAWTKTPFYWGTDNWNFLNSCANGDFSADTYRSQISSDYLDVLASNLTDVEYQVVFRGTSYSGGAWLDDTFGGSCYGMSSLALLAKQGIVPFSEYKSGASKLFDLDKPTANRKVSSLVTYYQMLQVKDIIMNQYRTVPYEPVEDTIKRMISLLDKNDTVLIGFRKNGWGGHAVLAFDYEYGSYTYNGVTYQGCIKICDPNASTAYNPQCNIYFNTRTYSWTIPFYSYANVNSASGAVFNYVGASVDEINEGGYLSGSRTKNTGSFVARIDAEAISDNRSVSKMKENADGNYMKMNSAPNDIIEDYFYIAGGESKGTIGYNLRDADAAYMVTQSEPVELKLSIDYQDCVLTGSSAAGNSVIFDKTGYVEVQGESAEYTMTMTFDGDHPTDWFAVQVKGSGSDKASLQKTKKGFVVSAENLKNMEVKANNRKDSAAVTFSTKYKSALIYEINKTTIGVKVDTDNDGTYETDVKTKAIVNLGDVNGDGEVSSADDRLALRASVKLEKYKSGSAEFLASDVNKDGKIGSDDARTILRVSVKLESFV